jgi:hypothetical protein
LFQTSPLFGIGAGMYAEEVGKVAHNSFLHACTELGLLGGSLFLGAFVYAIGTVHRLGRDGGSQLPAELRRLHPYVLASVVGLVVGLLSLSRVYTYPAYIVLGIVTVYTRLASAHAPDLVPQVDQRMVLRLFRNCLLFLVAAHLFVDFVVRWS